VRLGCLWRALKADRLQASLKSRLTVAQMAIMIAGTCAALAEERTGSKPSGAPIVFHIPAQPLAAALQTYGEKAGVQVLYESSSAVGRTSAAVEGNFRPEEALVLLLTGTDLKIQYTRPDAVTLALRSALPDGLSVSDPPAADLSLGTLLVRPTGEEDDVGRLHDYSYGLQADIQKVLQKSAGTREGNYRAVIDLWIDPLRTVQRIELVHSTGSESRDTAVAKALRGLTVSRPTPANAPQPVRIVIVVRSAR
jgi:hypothetical protein